MMNMTKKTRLLTVILLLAAGCSGSGNDEITHYMGLLPGFGTKYTVSGTVSGIVGSGLTLQLNGSDDLNLNSDGSFSFPDGLSNKAVYAVSISQQPNNPCQTCAVTNDSGIINKANVTNVTVTCGTPSYSLGGTLYGLGQGRSITLQTNNGQALTLNSNGPFTFPSLIQDGSVYSVSVQTGPLNQSVTVTSGGGTITHANVNNVEVHCSYEVSLLSYAANASSNMITISSINTATGGLSSAGTVPTGNYPVSLAVAPNNRFLYTANEHDNTVSAYSITPSTGALTSVPGSPFAAGSSPYFVAVDPYSRFVYTVNTVSNNVSAYTINSSTGALTPVAGSPFATGGNPVSMTIDPAGKFAYVANNADNGAVHGNTVSAFSINQTTGALSQISGSPYAVAGPQGIAIDPTGSIAFIVSQSNAKVNTYTINSSTGALTSVGSYGTGSSPMSVAVHPTAGFVYVANFNSANISAFSYASNGVLTPAGASLFSTGSHPSSMAFDPNGKFLHVSSMTGNAYAYSVNQSTGFLTPAPGEHYPIGSSPMSIATVLPGAFTFYVLRYYDNAIDACSLNINTGEVKLVQSVPFPVFGGSGSPPVIEPAGRFLHVSSSGSFGSNYTNVFSIDPSNGALSGIANSPFGSSEDGALAIHPSGKFSYVSGRWSTTKKNFSAYAIDPLTGSLTAMSGTFPQYNLSNEFKFDPTGSFAYITNFQNSQENSIQINAYSVNPLTGALTANVPGSPYTASGYVQSLTMDPAGNFIFMVDAAQFAVRVVSINPTTGALTPVAGSPFAAQYEASNMCIDPTGRFIYVSSYDDFAQCSLTGFLVNTSTGALTPIAGSTHNTGVRPNSLNVDPTGKYLYLMNGGNGSAGTSSVSVYLVNPVTGALTQTAGSPFYVNYNTGGTTRVNYTVK